ncbi:hypothetical protein OEZ86_009180 [Tetradesmus obliquus]|nr:hypothetical protein OEZ86_009180 [Tetradesmus obliquus]
MLGYKHTDVTSDKRGGAAGWRQRPLPRRAVEYAAGELRYLLGGLGLSVVVLDTQQQLAGGAVQQQQAGLGAACRLAVADHGQQAVLMAEALVHGPDTILVADIASPEEVAAARHITDQGVLLVAGASSSSLAQLLHTPALHCLAGVAAADEQGCLARAGASPFNAAVELLDKHRWRLHLDAGSSIDALLACCCC